MQALKNGQVDAADLFTTDPNIAANDLVVLEDPENLFAAQNVVPLITKSKSNDTSRHPQRGVGQARHRDPGRAAERVVIDKKDASVVAKEFLSEHGLA